MAAPEDRPLRIVGIGASAGGLEALEQLFTHLPPDSGMAFVLVQHLDPTRHSSMPEILSRLTRMPVHLVMEGMKIEPDSVYLIPPDKYMGVQNGALYLQELPQPRGLRMPVDFFFRTLAKDKGPDAIGIILSGTGTDGTLGLRSIKAKAGTVCVQSPASARYDGMPLSAINTGLADFVLPPDQIPGKLIDFVKHYVANGLGVSAVDEKTEPMRQIFAVLRSRSGHDFSRYKKPTLKRRVQRRMSVHGLHDVADYARLLRDSETEVAALLKDLLISVTSFFRDPEAFDALKDSVRELLKSKDEDADLRAWVAGCATGEEAYSIAMIVAECQDEMGKHLAVQIYGTDIDSDALNVARAGLYPANITADLTPERLRRFFRKEGKSFRIRKELRERVVFASQDFIKDPPFSRMDLICCRNLLIYLEGDLQKKLLPLLHYALKPGGLLFLGSSESIGEATDLFGVVDKKWKIYRRKEAAISPERLRFPSAFTLPSRAPAAGPMAVPAAIGIPEASEKIFLDNYAPTFAVVDEKYRLVYVRGRTGKYLEIASGQPSLSIVEMAREGLRSDLAMALHRATADKRTVVQEKVRVKHNGGLQNVILTVAPLVGKSIPPGLLIVVFQEVGTLIPEAKAGPATSRQRTALLEEELRLVRESLQSTIEEMEATNEELKSANEELQSNNEELQSTNEELDTSREELQSLNEELLTVNAELSAKTDMLTKANDDLKNYLNRTDIAIVFLDEELKIRSYTPATTDVFALRDVDVGRPLEELNSRLAYQGVVDDAREVLRTLVPKETDVQRKDGRWYTMRVLPYLTAQNVVSGLVMSFLDIDKQKQAAVELATANEQLRVALEEQSRAAGELRLLAAIVMDSNDAIISQDLEGKILTWNKAAELMYGYTKAEALGMDMALLAPEEARSEARQLLEDIKSGKEGGSFDVSRRTKDGRILSVWLTASKLVDDLGRAIGMSATERDVTERKIEKKLAQRTTELEGAYRELESFSQSVGHDLRAPLRTLDGFSEAALSECAGKLDDTCRDYFIRVLKASHEMGSLIDSLLKLSRIGGIDMNPETFNLSHVANTVAQQLLDTQPGRNVDFVISPEMEAEGDRQLLEILITNLLENSWKFTAGIPRARIEVGVDNQDGKTTYFVRDNGDGFDMAYANELFLPFRRLHDKKDFSGAGIGLTMAQRIVRRHGGRIWAKSEIGKGATFYFTLNEEAA